MAGFGTGIGLQGQPPIHGQYFNQRQQQEEARKNAKIKRDDDAYQKILEETVIKPGEYDWKVETKAREAVADFTYQVNKLRQEHPNTWENMVPQLKQDTLGKLQGYRSDSVALKAIREAKKTGKYYVPDSAGKYLDTGQGDMKGGLPGIVDQKLYGFVVDQDTGHIGYNPVEKRSIQQEIEQRITSKKDAFQDEIDPATGLPKVYIYKGQGGAMEQQTRRTLQPGQVDDLYAGLTTDPHFSQNINIAYANELKKRPDYNDSMIVGPDGNFNPEFIKGATQYGRDLAGNMARNYYTPNTIPMPAKNVTNINNQISLEKEKARTVSAIAPQKINVTRKGVKIPDPDGTTDKDGKPIMVDSEDLVEISSPAQFTTAPFKGFLAVSPTTYDLQTNERVEKAGVDKAEYGTFAVVPIRNGAMVPYGTDKGSQYKTLEEAIKKGEVEWKVVGIGTYDDETGDGKVPKTIYRDAEELIGAADAPLTEAEKKDFKRNIEELKATAAKYNSTGNVPPAVKTSSSTLQDRKGNPNKPSGGTTIGGKTYTPRQ